MNSTPERGFEAKVLHFFHRVFNLLKNQDPVYNSYTARNVENPALCAGPGMECQYLAHTPRTRALPAAENAAKIKNRRENA